MSDDSSGIKNFSAALSPAAYKTPDAANFLHQGFRYPLNGGLLLSYLMMISLKEDAIDLEYYQSLLTLLKAEEIASA